MSTPRLTRIDRFHGHQICAGCGDDLHVNDTALVQEPRFWGTQCGCAELRAPSTPYADSADCQLARALVILADVRDMLARIESGDPVVPYVAFGWRARIEAFLAEQSATTETAR